MGKQLVLKLLNPQAVLLLNLFLAGGFFIAFYRFWNPSFLPCTRRFAQAILLALGMTLVLNLLAVLFWKRHGLSLSRPSLLILAGLCLLAFWAGSYSYGLQGRTGADFLRGFLITRQGRVNETVAPGAVLSLRAGSPVGIALLSDLPNLGCRWSTLQSGALDDFSSCDTTYLVPMTDFDILSVRIEPGCGLPSTYQRIKISILP